MSLQSSNFDNVTDSSENFQNQHISFTSDNYNYQEVARQERNEDLYIYDLNENDEFNISLISDSAAGDNNEVPEPNLEENFEDKNYFPQAVTSDLSSKDLLKIALNLDNNYDYCNSDLPPFKNSWK
uniref:Uncharacterized protein n=1 Tax=Panagrolaimus superbus TaxID=310955 RepID=A0A914YKR2_9BILA